MPTIDKKKIIQAINSISVPHELLPAIMEKVNLLKPENIQYLKNFKAKLMARSPLASGCLSGKLNIKSKFSKNDHRSGWLNDKNRLKNILFQLREIKKIISSNLREKSKIFLSNVSLL